MAGLSDEARQHVHDLVRDNLETASRQQFARDEAGVLAGHDGFAVLARMLARIERRLIALEARHGE